jgi:TetR/AcrR family transcriptional repressor of nem operon
MTKFEKIRRFILEQSAIIFNKKEVAATSISDLMESTKLAKGGIYGNLISKAEISLEVFEYLASIVSSALDKAIAGKMTAREKLFTILDHCHTMLASSETGGWPLLNFGIEADDTNPDHRQRVAKQIKKSRHRIASVFERGQATGEFNYLTDARIFAIKMFTMMEGGIYASRVTNNKGVMKTIVDVLKKEINIL